MPTAESPSLFQPDDISLTDVSSGARRSAPSRPIRVTITLSRMIALSVRQGGGGGSGSARSVRPGRDGEGRRDEFVSIS